MHVNSQPRGFSIFFLTEIWERYGFYVIQTLLVFYLLNQLKLGDTSSYAVVGSFTGLAYINSIFGGLIADRLTGASRTLIIGGVILFFGYSILAITDNLMSLNIGLACVSVGTGLLKPNVSSLLSVIYKEDEVERKDAGYTIYYVGIYVGALGGSLGGGYIQKLFGWSFAFYSSALGCLIATCIALIGRYKYNLRDLSKLKIEFMTYIWASIYIVLLILIAFLVFYSSILSSVYFMVVGIFCVLALFYCIFKHNGRQRRRFIAFSLLVLVAVIYWAIFFQQFFSISLATARTTNTSIPHSSLPTAETIGVIIFGQIINYVWYRLRNHPFWVSIPFKFSLGLLFNALTFLFLALALYVVNAIHTYLPIWVIVVAYLLVSIGEVCLAPTSLSMATSLVPKQYVGIMMGISLLSVGFGGKLAGLLAEFSAMDNQHIDLASSQLNYMDAFFNYFLISIIAWGIVLLLSKFIRKLILHPVARY